MLGADAFAEFDNWIHVNEPKVKVGRKQNFRCWSPAMVPDRTLAALAANISVWRVTACHLLAGGVFHPRAQPARPSWRLHLPPKRRLLFAPGRFSAAEDRAETGGARASVCAPFVGEPSILSKA